MADTTLDDGTSEATEVEALPRQGGARSRKLLLVALLVLLLLGGGFAGAWFAGLLDDLLPQQEEKVDAATVQPVFHDLPELLVNLEGEGRKQSFLKLSVSLELKSESDRAMLEQRLPRIVDAFQVYLRELRVEDLRGSAGMQRLREELLIRVNAAVAPVAVRDVLFKEMLVQ